MRIAGIMEESIVDGSGIRYVLFCQRCKHNCKGCFNPETHQFDGGKEIVIDDIIKRVIRVSHRKYHKGITFSGGDCFEQALDCSIIAKAIKGLGWDVWAYTGYTYEEIIAGMKWNQGWTEFMNEIDVLVDGKFEIENKDLTLKFRGSSNQRLIDVPKSLVAGEVIEINL